jgi:protein SCO1/2
MSRPRRCDSFGPRLALAALVILAAAPGVARASFYGKHTGPLPAIGTPSDKGPVSAVDIDIIENLGQRVPRGLRFVDGHGATVSVDELLARGKPLLVTLGYYHCPMLCNLVHEGLAKAIRDGGLQPGRDFLGLAVSVDPDEDPKSANTQQGRLLRALQHERKDDWSFVMGTVRQSPDRGPDPDVKRLAESVGFRYKYDPASKLFAHSAVAFVLSPGGIISRYLYNVEFKARDLRFALVEASGGKVGTSLDRVLLSCFKYDPMTHRYTPFAEAFVRIGAMLSFLALVGLLAVLWRREWVMSRRRRTA